MYPRSLRGRGGWVIMNVVAMGERVVRDLGEGSGYSLSQWKLRVTINARGAAHWGNFGVIFFWGGVLRGGCGQCGQCVRGTVYGVGTGEDLAN